MSIAPIPAHQALPKQNRARTDSVSFGRMPVPAHQIVARNGQSVSEGATPEATKQAAKAAEKPFSLWDLVDIVNPLQHIPVVSTLYRQITGDEINNFARVAGGALFGGIVGAAVGGINAVMVDNTGKDVGQTVLAQFTSDDDAPAKAAAVPAAPVVANAMPLQNAPLAPAPSQALFDRPGAGSIGSTSSKAAPAPSMPVIEVRPNAMMDVKPSLPVSKDLAGLADLEPGTPVKMQKSQVQQAMMDALLKMQEDKNKPQDHADLSGHSADAKI